MATKFLDNHIAQRMSRTANGAVTENRLVAIDGTDHEQAAQVSGANAVCDGIALSTVADTKEFAIATGGRLQVLAGGAVVPGDELVSDANGKAVKRGTTATVLYNVNGRALTTAAADELVMVAWGPYSVWGANAS